MKIWDIIFEIKDNLGKANARMDELQKRVEALNKPTQADDVKLSKEQIIDCIKQHMREIGELCKDNDVEYLSLCYLKGRISFHTLGYRDLDIDCCEEL